MSVNERMREWLDSCGTEFVLAIEAPKFIAQERELNPAGWSSVVVARGAKVLRKWRRAAC